ncbi:hypothetical protein MRX96_044218 [Rhipicephalus microplus]
MQLLNPSEAKTAAAVADKAQFLSYALSVRHYSAVVPCFWSAEPERDAVVRTKRASQESNLSISMILVPRGAVRLRPGGCPYPCRLHWWNYEGPYLPKPW